MRGRGTAASIDVLVHPGSSTTTGDARQVGGAEGRTDPVAGTAGDAPMLPVQAPHDPDHLLLAIRIHECGLWTTEVHRDGDGFFVLAASTRVDVPGRAGGEDLDGWADAAVGRILMELRDAS